MSHVDNSYKVDMIEKAYAFAKKAHLGQVDKGGKPYIEHVLKVAGCFEDDYEAKVVGLLHDIVEDTEYTLEDIAKEGFEESIIEAIRVITKDDDMEYMSYIKAISFNRLARRVKIEDLKHNMDISRIQNPTQVDIKRVEKYKKALVYLEKTNGEDTK